MPPTSLVPVPPNEESNVSKMTKKQRRRHYQDVAADQINQFLFEEEDDAIEAIGEFKKAKAHGRSGPRFKTLMQNVYAIATGKSMQAITAANALLDRGIGKIAPSAEEQEAAAKAGVRLVFVQRPEIDAEIVEQGKIEESVPEFEEDENEQ